MTMLLAPARLALVLACTATALCACGPSNVRISEREPSMEEGAPLRAINTLNCPDHHGDLTRIETAADGLSCLYSGPRGSRLSLQLVTLEADQDLPSVLAPFDQSMRALMPETAARAAGGEDGTTVSVQSDGENARVRLPGIRIDQDGERASVNIGGIQIHADGASEPTDGDIVLVNANGEAAEVRTRSQGPDVRATYVLNDEVPTSEGWHTVGYEARGPAAGPIVVATVRSKSPDEENLFEAARELVVLNVGGAP
ncbi:MAG TPA: methyltransferase type 11 [Brevundimonas sp.]|uniref:methyltransferase type 11 n=1 Tax=Brevundimonas sp. TaxID=1871086 RepID=UPI002BBEB5F7|nr:methyltransferase type 11 [Brevundimonas sp.]HRH20126.1 methyltransferase type 11 [Brevundimonas sp.]